MIDLNLLRETPDIFRQALAARQMDASLVEQVLELDAQRRAVLQEVEALKAERNLVSKEIGRMRDPVQKQAKVEAMRLVGDRVGALDGKLRRVEAMLDEVIAAIPNLPDVRTPYGKDESANVVIKTVGQIPEFNYEPKPHWDLGPRLGIIDFERGVKITGSRFFLLSGAGARLQRALIAWMLDLHIRQGYTEKYPPFMVKSQTLFGAGQLPKFADNLYKDHEEDLWMVPTAEVPLTDLHMDEILEQADLPLRYTAYTPCFRREKMSAGRDVRGIKRGHQFDKVEMYIFCLPEDSPTQFEKMVSDAEQTCAELGFTYWVVQLCTGDLGFGSSITYDIEGWAPGCGEWLGGSSISNVTDFQT